MGVVGGDRPLVDEHGPPLRLRQDGGLDGLSDGHGALTGGVQQDGGLVHEQVQPADARDAERQAAEQSDGKVSADLAQDVPGASIRDLDQQMPYANVRFSYWVAPSFGVELGYLILKPLDFSLQADDPERDVEALKDSLDRNLPVTGPGITLALKTQKAWDRWRIEGRAGAWFGLRNDVSFFVDDDKVRQADERVAGLLGVSGHYRLHPHWDLGLELTGMHADHTVGGAGLVLTFTP